jgi:hypothetical protein
MEGEQARELESLIKFLLAFSTLTLAIIGSAARKAWLDSRKTGEPMPTQPVRFACVPYLAAMMLLGYGVMFVAQTLPAYLIVGGVYGLSTPLRMIVYRRVLYGMKTGFDWSLFRRPKLWVARTIGMTFVHTLVWPVSAPLAFAFFAEETKPARW